MKYTIFGESHGPAIGVTLTGVPAGLELDWETIETDMARQIPSGHRPEGSGPGAGALRDV